MPPVQARTSIACDLALEVVSIVSKVRGYPVRHSSFARRLGGPLTCVVVDAELNCVQIVGRTIYGRGRYVGLVLAELAGRGNEELSATALQRALRDAGQRFVLDRTGIRRLWLQTEQLVDALLGPGAFAARLIHGPRRRTVGPWLWTPAAEEAWRIKVPVRRGPIPKPGNSSGREAGLLAQHRGDETAPAEDSGTGPWIADTARSSLRILELTLAADALSASGQMKDAIERLRAATRVGGLSNEMLCQLDLRLAWAWKRVGQFDQAEQQLAAVTKRARRAEHRDRSQYGLSRQLMRRIAYDRDPPYFGGRDPGAVPFAAMPVADPRGLAQAENLEALMARRAAQSQLRDGKPAAADALLNQAWARASAAMYWAVSLPDHENAENFAFNMGLIQASRHDCGDPEAVTLAFESYRLGMQIRDDFMVGKDSTWDQIFISNLWLDHPDRRADFDAALSFDRTPLSKAEFYVRTLHEAKRIAEPRQIVQACINLWRFGAEVIEGAAGSNLQQQAKRELEQTARAYSRKLLDDDWTSNKALIAKIFAHKG